MPNLLFNNFHRYYYDDGTIRSSGVISHKWKVTEGIVYQSRIFEYGLGTEWIKVNHYGQLAYQQYLVKLITSE